MMYTIKQSTNSCCVYYGGWPIKLFTGDKYTTYIEASDCIKGLGNGE